MAGDGTGEEHQLQAGAAAEGQIAQGGELPGENQLRQPGTAIKGIGAHGGEAFRQAHPGKGGTVLESTLPDGGESLRQGEPGQIAVILERAAAQGGDSLADAHAGDVVFVNGPGGILAAVVIGKAAGAGEGQAAGVPVKGPLEALAAGAGGGIAQEEISQGVRGKAEAAAAGADNWHNLGAAAHGLPEGDGAAVPIAWQIHGDAYREGQIDGGFRPTEGQPEAGDGPGQGALGRRHLQYHGGVSGGGVQISAQQGEAVSLQIREGRVNGGGDGAPGQLFQGGHSRQQAGVAEVFRPQGLQKLLGVHLMYLRAQRLNGEGGGVLRQVCQVLTVGAAHHAASLDGSAHRASGQQRGAGIQRERAAGQNGDGGIGFDFQHSPAAHLKAAAGGDGQSHAVQGQVGVQDHAFGQPVAAGTDGQRLLKIRLGHGGQTGVGVEFGGGKLENAVVPGAEHGFYLIVVRIVEAADDVAAFHTAAAAAQKFGPSVGGGAVVAVGHVHEIADAVDADDVPFVIVAAGAVALHILLEGGAVAQVLEGLGVALAHHVGGSVVVEYVYQSPGIDIPFIGLVVGGIVVIGD